MIQDYIADVSTGGTETRAFGTAAKRYGPRMDAENADNFDSLTERGKAFGRGSGAENRRA
jgi:hypothetical protein